MRPAPPPESRHGEAARAFLQARVALFWKVLFILTLVSIGLGAVGAIADPGFDFVLVVASALQSGLCWQLCARGQRSVRFSRAVESVGLIVNLSIGAIMGRYLLAEVSLGHTVTSPDTAAMTDGYVSMLLLGGVAMLTSIRAALIPSRTRRTVTLTTLAGVPLIVAPILLTPDGNGIALRPFSSAELWLPTTIALMWGFVVTTAAVISWVIYGLRKEVKEARRLGQYVLERKLGEGGMGEVYRARHGMMKRPTAIKLLRAERSDEIDLQRFEREVQQTARLTHPNTITLFDYGHTEDGVFYYAMELLDGGTLARIVEVDGAQPPGRVVKILSMACAALAEAHGVGLIHRDIKPANIMLCRQGGELDVVKLLDFGLVKQLKVDQDVGLTGANAIAGTPQYLAPESIRDPESVDERTDLYALGAVAYYLLAGEHVFGGRTVVEVCGQHLHQEPDPLSQRGVDVPADLEAVVLACLSKDPALRPPSAAVLREQIEACLVAPWTGADAIAWWRDNQPDLDEAPDPAPRGEMTIDVNRSMARREQTTR